MVWAARQGQYHRTTHGTAAERHGRLHSKWGMVVFGDVVTFRVGSSSVGIGLQSRPGARARPVRDNDNGRVAS
jgi:hypothetical protein